MLMRGSTLTVLAGGLLAATGCAGGLSIHYFNHEPRPARVVHVDIDHCDHGYGCNHYYDGTRWLVVRHGHVHGPGCGHYFTGTRWIVRATPAHTHKAVRIVKPQKKRRIHISKQRPRVKKAKRLRRVSHAHGADCGCVYDRGTWIRVAAGHVHHPGCGHFLIHGRWSIRY